MLDLYLADDPKPDPLKIRNGHASGFCHSRKKVEARLADCRATVILGGKKQSGSDLAAHLCNIPTCQASGPEEPRAGNARRD
jgi:hypothetical protein